MYVSCGSSVTWLKIVTLVGVGIWTVPLVWYFKYYKKEQQK